MGSVEFQVTGMSCGHCEAAIRSELDAVAGVDSVEVSAQTGRLVVMGDADPAAVIAAVDEAGYQAALL